ncbi:YqiJ family protein [Synechococcus sp. PCC 6716]|nr:YqiJ family protein [Synechococcus sp. PCC 6716]
MLFHLVHLPYWIVLGMGILLFLTVIVGDIGDEDAEVDTDADALEVDIDGEEGMSLLTLLHWLGVGRAPLILLLALDFSFLGLLGWLLNVLFYLVNGSWPMGGWGALIAIVAIGSSLGLGSLCSRPLGRIFAQFSEDTSGDRLLGCQGHVSSAQIPPSGAGIGQVSVLDAARNRLTVPAVLPPWATVIPQYRQDVLIIDRQGSEYVVIAKDSLDEGLWLRQQKQPSDEQHS